MNRHSLKFMATFLLVIIPVAIPTNNHIFLVFGFTTTLCEISHFGTTSLDGCLRAKSEVCSGGIYLFLIKILHYAVGKERQYADREVCIVAQSYTKL